MTARWEAEDQAFFELRAGQDTDSWAAFLQMADRPIVMLRCQEDGEPLGGVWPTRHGLLWVTRTTTETWSAADGAGQTEVERKLWAPRLRLLTEQETPRSSRAASDLRCSKCLRLKPELSATSILKNARSGKRVVKI